MIFNTVMGKGDELMKDTKNDSVSAANGKYTVTRGSITIVVQTLDGAVRCGLAGQPGAIIRDETGEDVTDQLLDPYYMKGKLTITEAGCNLLVMPPEKTIPDYPFLMQIKAVRA